MKIVFFSNFLNPHQLAFCKEIIKIPDMDFTFVATQAFDSTVVTSGFSDMNLQYNFCLPSYLNSENSSLADKLCMESDIAIIGSAPKKYLKLRLKENKITFRYSERIFKPLNGSKFNPITILGMIKGNTIYNNKPLFMLCASAYTAQDFRFVGAYKNKSFKWGYFPKGSDKTLEELRELKAQNIKPVITWAGRMVQYKHVEYAIETAIYLKDNNIDFLMNIIGDGETQLLAKDLVIQHRLNENVKFLGSISNTETITQLEKTNIFIATSDYNEGWGAVVNEAMSAGCAVVASSAMGCVPFLIEDGVNGLSFPFENKSIMFEKVKEVVLNQEFCKVLSENAKKTIVNTWNAKTAAENLSILCNELMYNKSLTNKNGPCEKI